MTGRHPAAQRFPFVDGELLVGGIPLRRLAARVGRTPFYAFDRALVAQRVGELRAVLPPVVRLHYAVKANPMPALLGWLAPRVDGMDVASGAELRAALDAGVAPQETSFAGPAKTETELVQAVAAGVLVNVESLREIHLLAEASAALRLPARVALRVNPEHALRAAGMEMGGVATQFGIDAAQAPEALREIGRLGLAFEGFHVFAGSQSLRADAIGEAQAEGLALAVRLAVHAGAPVRVLNLGGGLGIPYFPGDAPLDLAAVGAHMQTLAAQARRALPQATLVLELGRYLVGEAGVYVARVIDRKVSRGEVFLVTDGGLHHHLSASGNLGQVIRKNFPVEVGTRSPAAARKPASVTGPLCTPLDLLAHRTELAEAGPGDLVVVYQSGAYGRSASPADFLGHPPALEVLV